MKISVDWLGSRIAALKLDVMVLIQTLLRRQKNVYVADRSNRRIQVFDADGKYLRSIVLNAPYDKKRHPVLGNAPANSPDGP